MYNKSTPRLDNKNSEWVRKIYEYLQIEITFHRINLNNFTQQRDTYIQNLKIKNNTKSA